MKGSKEISNDQDVIDSRDIIERIRYLESEREDLEQAITDAQEARDDAEDEEGAPAEDLAKLEEAAAAAHDDVVQWDEDNGDELKALKALAEEAEGYCSDWHDGAALIHENYWVEHCKQECADLGYISKDFPWWIEIDWEKTAANIAQDYTEVDFDGATYYVRS